MSAPTVPGYTLARPHRADARRNFDRLLTAARQAFERHGADVPLEDIARDAGVGIATLYRNFPTRQALFEAVYVGQVEELAQAAHDAAAEEPDPWTAWTRWLDRFASYVVTKHAVLDGMGKDTELFRACKGTMVAAAEPLFRAAQDAGQIRADAAFDDVLWMVASVISSSFHDDGQRERVIGLALDGIRPRG